MSEPFSLMSIGYGRRSVDQFLELLSRHRIQYLVDVRSFPNSRFNPDFSRRSLEIKLAAAGIGYVFLGHQLGGNPSNPEVRVDAMGSTEDEYLVDYNKQKELPEFQNGLERLRRANEIAARVVVMCSESKPEVCHRTRLIGEALGMEGIPMAHIDENGDVRSQQEIMLRLTKGQPLLPGIDPPTNLHLSSRAWRERRSSRDDQGNQE